MAGTRNLFGNLNLIRGENPNGMVTHGPNGPLFNGQGGDGDDYTYSVAADGPRWNKTEPDGLMQDKTLPRPVNRGKRR